jgi:hypothetical protein
MAMDDIQEGEVTLTFLKQVRETAPGKREAYLSKQGENRGEKIEAHTISLLLG